MARFAGSSTSGVGGGSHEVFGHMKNTTPQRQRKGKPIPLGERPEGRPMAHELPGAPKIGIQPVALRKAGPTECRDKVTGVRCFSWESRDADG